MGLATGGSPWPVLTAHGQPDSRLCITYPIPTLVHGFSLDHTTWNPLAERLDAVAHRVVALDIRGHGESTLGSESPAVDRHLTDLRQLIDELGLGPVHLVGHSFGAG